MQKGIESNASLLHMCNEQWSREVIATGQHCQASFAIHTLCVLIGHFGIKINQVGLAKKGWSSPDQEQWSDRGTFWNSNIPTAVVAGDGPIFVWVSWIIYNHFYEHS